MIAVWRAYRPLLEVEEQKKVVERAKEKEEEGAAEE